MNKSLENFKNKEKMCEESDKLVKINWNCSKKLKKSNELINKERG